jgi:hypothetical protein
MMCLNPAVHAQKGINVSRWYLIRIVHTLLVDKPLNWTFPYSELPWKQTLRRPDTVLSKQTTNSVALSPQANYTDWATATCWRNLVPTFVVRGVSHGQCGRSPTVVNLSFLDQSHYFFFQVAPHLSSQGLSGPRSKPTATQKIWQPRGSNPDLWVCSQIFWPLDHRGGHMNTVMKVTVA